MFGSHPGAGGSLAVHVPGFRAALAVRCYSERAVRTHVELLRHLGSWLQDEDLSLLELTADRVAEFLTVRRRLGGRGLITAFGVAPLLEYLAGLGLLPPQSRSVPAGPASVVLERYRNYLLGERGVAAQGVIRYERLARLFVSSVAVGDEVDWPCVSASDVSCFVVRECSSRRGSAARNLAAALRSFLRFVHVDGWTPLGLAGAVPPVGGWRAQSLPLGLAPDQVRRLLDSCDSRRESGRRDFAILTMLVRLGLRAGEVAAMRLEDIDWRAAEIVVHGKDRRDELLPLPNDVGKALTDYLSAGRPPTTSRAVFLRVLAPRQQLTPTAVTAIVYGACDRVGLPRVGAHRLRHTAASAMLGAGASLSEVGQALRQRELKTTAIYAKVDDARLRLLAQPWPGGAA